MLSLLLLALPSAHAWEHTGLAWSLSDFPLQWYTALEYEEDSLDPGYGAEVLKLSWDNWYDAECAAIGHSYIGNRNQLLRSTSDAKITIHWEDPGDEIEPGVLGVTYSVPGYSVVKETSTRIYRQVADSDIVFNDNVDFGSNADIEQDCGSQTSIESVATHEIGHLHGLAHSCEEGDLCTETDLLEATMYWSVGPCDTQGAVINSDDIQSITNLYGTSAIFQATTSRIGANPLAVGFEIVSDTEVIGATWKFGDGETSTELSPTHQYLTPGQFTVEAAIELQDPVCGTSTYTYDQLGYVLACAEPVGSPGTELEFAL